MIGENPGFQVGRGEFTAWLRLIPNMWLHCELCISVLVPLRDEISPSYLTRCHWDPMGWHRPWPGSEIWLTLAGASCRFLGSTDVALSSQTGTSTPSFYQCILRGLSEMRCLSLCPLIEKVQRAYNNLVQFPKRSPIIVFIICQLMTHGSVLQDQRISALSLGPLIPLRSLNLKRTQGINGGSS